MRDTIHSRSWTCDDIYLTITQKLTSASEWDFSVDRNIDRNNSVFNDFRKLLCFGLNFHFNYTKIYISQSQRGQYRPLVGESSAEGANKIVTKERSRIDICMRGDIKLKLTKLTPNIKNLAAKQQLQGSH